MCDLIPQTCIPPSQKKKPHYTFKIKNKAHYPKYLHRTIRAYRLLYFNCCKTLYQFLTGCRFLKQPMSYAITHWHSVASHPIKFFFYSDRQITYHQLKYAYSKTCTTFKNQRYELARVNNTKAKLRSLIRSSRLTSRTCPPRPG